MNNSTYKVLYFSRYSFPDKATGKLVERATVQYLSPNPVDEPDKKGIPANTVPCPYPLCEKLTHIPGQYDLTFAAIPDNRGRPQMTLVDAKLVEK